MGAPEDDAENTDGGTAYLVLGGSDHAGLISAHSRLRGTTTTALMGAAVCGPGDLDGDGLSDLVVGAPGADEGENNNGAAYVYLGTVEGDLEDTDAWATLYGEDGGDRAGDALAGPGDFNGDGSADLVIGAQRQGGVLAYAGAAYVVLGPVTGKMGLGSAHARLQGQSAYAFSGAAVAPAGDPDWDGRQDLLVGAPGQETSGTAGGGAWLVLASGM